MSGQPTLSHRTPFVHICGIASWPEQQRLRLLSELLFKQFADAWLAKTGVH